MTQERTNKSIWMATFWISYKNGKRVDTKHVKGVICKGINEEAVLNRQVNVNRAYRDLFGKGWQSKAEKCNVLKVELDQYIGEAQVEN